MNQREIYFSYINKIEDYGIRKAVQEIVDTRVPTYFFEIPASNTGKHHGGETLVQHVVDCADMLITYTYHSLRAIWTPYQFDMALAAILLHDCWRCGAADGIKDKDGVLVSQHSHPEIGYNVLHDLARYPMGIPATTKSEIERAVRWHYGPWSTWMPEEDIKEFMNLPYTDIAMQVFIIDSSNTWNREQLRNKKNEDYPDLFLHE